MRPIVAHALVAVLSASLVTGLVSCSRGGGPEVVAYVSEDQVFSEPILRDFERETGIRVRAVFDTEEAKSTGVMNRLIAERGNPQADVYWANDFPDPRHRRDGSDRRPHPGTHLVQHRGDQRAPQPSLTGGERQQPVHGRSGQSRAHDQLLRAGDPGL